VQEPTKQVLDPVPLPHPHANSCVDIANKKERNRTIVFIFRSDFNIEQSTIKDHSLGTTKLV
jgi:hypothetical protein